MRGRVLVAALAVLGIVIGLVAFPSAAMAYTTTGTTWSTGTLRIDYRFVNGNFRTALNSGKSNYNSTTHVSLSTVDVSGPTWTAENANYGLNGYEGYATWTNIGGLTLSCDMWLNQTYLSGSEPVTQLKVVWEHETGHCLGLNHVSSPTHVMYASASTAYSNGVTGLTTDDKNGINALY
jgi:hypothetical protein